MGQRIEMQHSGQATAEPFVRVARAVVDNAVFSSTNMTIILEIFLLGLFVVFICVVSWIVIILMIRKVEQKQDKNSEELQEPSLGKQEENDDQLREIFGDDFVLTSVTKSKKLGEGSFG